MRTLLIAVLLVCFAFPPQAARADEALGEDAGHPRGGETPQQRPRNLQAASAEIIVGPHHDSDAIQAALDRLRPGQVLRLSPGRYVGLTLTLRRPGMVIEADGAVMDGAALEIDGAALTQGSGALAYPDLPPSLDPFEPDWIEKQAPKEAPTPELQAREMLWVCPSTGSGQADYDACERYDRRPSGEILDAGEFATDGGTLFVGDDGGDWSRRVLLWPQTPRALSCTSAAKGTTIRGLTVRRYAPSFHIAQVNLSDCEDITLDRVSIIESSSIGLQPGNNFRAVDSHFDDNGQMGVVGWAELMTFEDSSANRNNHRGFPTNWNAGGVKVNAPGSGVPFEDPDQAITQVVWIGGEIAENEGTGFWSDGSAWKPILRDALVRGNTGVGAHIELTFEGFIEGNVFRGNGRRCSGSKSAGSAILINGTSDAVVRDNLIVVDTDCGRGINFGQRKVGHWQTKRNQVVDNTTVYVAQDSYSTMGFWIVQKGDPSVEDRVADNVIDRNTYVLAEGDNNKRWRYQTWKPSKGGTLSWSEWRARGHDRNGQLLRVPDPAAWAAANSK